MGRLLAALRADSGTAPTATPATLLLAEIKSSRVASVAAPTASQNERLLAAIRAEVLPDSLLSTHDGTDDDLAALSDKQLCIYVAMMGEGDLRERGKTPPDETARALCRHCGPIWINPSIASVAPVVEGWPRLLGCPWCHVRNRQALPRPLVACGDCQHFIRDAVNPRDGMGSCGGHGEPERPYPAVKKICATFYPAAT